MAPLGSGSVVLAKAQEAPVSFLEFFSAAHTSLELFLHLPGASSSLDSNIISVFSTQEDQLALPGVPFSTLRSGYTSRQAWGVIIEFILLFLFCGSQKVCIQSYIMVLLRSEMILLPYATRKLGEIYKTILYRYWKIGSRRLFSPREGKRYSYHYTIVFFQNSQYRIFFCIHWSNLNFLSFSSACVLICFFGQ